MTLQPGAVLHNRYRIVKLLGQGGFGILYRVWDTTLGRPCALKENLDVSPENQRQFLREARIMSNLTHANLPRVTDFFISGSQQYLVMDFVEGQDLQEMLDDRGSPLPEDLVLPWIGQVCDALSYLHTQNPPIIHRDVKPANIKITPTGQAVLVDFGIAKVYDPGQKTTVGAQAVTPGFSPIEQYGKSATDARTDIYALGATLYTLLTGLEPLESTQRVVHDPLLPPRYVNSNLGIRTSSAIMRALQLDPSQRFQSAADFKQALIPPPARQVARPLAPPVPPAAPTPASARPVPWGWVAPGVTLLLLIIFIGTWLATSGRVGGDLPGTQTALAAAPLIVNTPSPIAEQITPLLPLVDTPTDSAFTPALAKPGTTTPLQATPSVYLVQPGDTCSGIAVNFDVSIRSIAELNALPEDCGLLFAGQSLLIPAPADPGGTPPPSATPAPVTPQAIRLDPLDGMVQVYVSAGEFWMGAYSDDPDAVDEEQPQHLIYLSAFWIDQTEVTNGMYQRCVGAGACLPPGQPGSKQHPLYYADSRYQDYPVIYVSWNDADTYCRWVDRRLPSEAEWEKAARGAHRRLYPWGDEAPDAGRANFNKLIGDTTVAGNFPAGASPYAALDLAGNVAEWVNDWYGADYYAQSPLRNPLGPASGDYKILRGGSWFSPQRALRAAFRLWNLPGLQSDSSGFRCARSP